MCHVLACLFVGSAVRSNTDRRVNAGSTVLRQNREIEYLRRHIAASGWSQHILNCGSKDQLDQHIFPEI